jgi:hypothetical protein
MIVEIVLRCSFGDERKGKVVFDLLQKNNFSSLLLILLFLLPVSQ